VLETLNKYIEEAADQTGFPRSLWVRATGDRRLTRLLVASFVVHIIFYAAIIRLDWWSLHRVVKMGGREPDLVQITELAPPPDRFKLRQPPEAIDRADLTRLQYDPENSDDTHLLSRSPHPAKERGANGSLPSADAIEQRLRAMRGGSPSSSDAARRASPPTTAPVQITGQSPSDISAVTQAPVTPAAAVPPPPSTKPNPAAGTGSNREPPAVGDRRGEGTESVAFGLQQVEGQYRAAVRAKIRKVNEANMPREWVKDVLRDKVSTDFALMIRRDGRIGLLQMTRSSGYRVLDEAARQAIYIASPFEGFPQNAGETILLTVTVYFFPLE
jgi:TonB-like protein